MDDFCMGIFTLSEIKTIPYKTKKYAGKTSIIFTEVFFNGIFYEK